MKRDYRDNYYGSILDPLHNDIKLSEIEKWCISQPIFSRLRRVKQNTFLYYVFPSANHTRFEHSIGVMHIAGRIFDACKENYATGNKKMEKYQKKDQYIFFDLNTLDDKEELYYQELRLAALLHDIGHGPLSHLFDEFAISEGAFLKVIEGDAILKTYLAGFQKLIIDNKNKVEHELISCAHIFKLIANLQQEHKDNPQKFSTSAGKIINSISAERIVKLIEPNFPNLLDFEDVNGNIYSHFFSRIVTAFPIDADRMDYLLRDSYFSGVTYGIYDINRIFSSFIAMLSDKEVQLVFKESGLESMLRFIQSRSHLYSQVYFHKTNRAANTMLSYATKSMRGKVKLLDQMKTYEELHGFYLLNSDEYFLTKTVRDKLTHKSPEKDVLEALINRKLFKRVYQKNIVLLPEKKDDDFAKQLSEIKNICERIDSKLESLEPQSIFATSDSFTNYTYKDADKSVLIAVKKENSYTSNKDWKMAGKEFQLADINVLMVRIYLNRNFSTPSEYEEKKEMILNTVAQEISELELYEG